MSDWLLFSAERHIAVNLEEIEKLPRGCLTKKKIKGKEYQYLQWREGNKTRSKYIRADLTEDIRKQLTVRKKTYSAKLKNQFMPA